VYSYFYDHIMATSWPIHRCHIVVIWAIWPKCDKHFDCIGPSCLWAHPDASNMNWMLIPTQDQYRQWPHASREGVVMGGGSLKTAGLERCFRSTHFRIHEAKVAAMNGNVWAGNRRNESTCHWVIESIVLCSDAGCDGSVDVLIGVGHGDLSGGMSEKNRREDIVIFGMWEWFFCVCCVHLTHSKWSTICTNCAGTNEELEWVLTFSYESLWINVGFLRRICPDPT